MILLNYENSLLSKDQIKRTGSLLYPYVRQLQEVAKLNDYSMDESSINLPFDENTLKEMYSVSKEYSLSAIKYLIIIGIGGSSLGTKAVLKALRKENREPEVLFLENITEAPYLDYQNAGEVLVNVVSKSGDTLETRTNLERLLEKYPDLTDRVVFTSTRKVKGKSLGIPEKVGGRFSVLSSVGLFPFALSGLSLFDLLQGAMQARKDSLDPDVFKNPALLSAVITYLNYIAGSNIKTTFVFHPALEDLGKWYQQLMAESLGKDGKGITPLVSVGTQDLHSMLQLYLEGPNDKLTEFVYAESDLIPETDVILEGVRQSYRIHRKPFTEVSMTAINEDSLGYYLQFKMMEVMYLGYLLEINAFNQPSVEDYKKYATETLGKN
jgi:glucose-6-phosphate isomerase